METNSVVVIGAGAAGLAAADSLSRSGVAVRLLEARNRLGGRIFTVSSQPGDVPIELGAEFVHGDRNTTWELIRAARLRTQKVPDRHWNSVHGQISDDPKFWEELEKVTRGFSIRNPDRDFGSFLQEVKGLSGNARRLARDYVEGFHAADVGRIGIHALARAEHAAQHEGGTHQFRIAAGYSALLDWLEARLRAQGVKIHSETVVKTVRWEPGRVEIEAQTPLGWRRFSAGRALVTVPLGLLQASGQGGLWFEPKLAAKQEAIQGLAMGSVAKVTFQFEHRFWPVENFGFIHSDDQWWPTWWSDERGPLITGWTGGPRARRLLEHSQAELVSHALDALSRLFKVEPNETRKLLVRSYTHDWDKDPFSRGAYSYTPVDMGDMPASLAEPVADTLFFAGEATDGDGDQGTVHGAIKSGWRAAEEIVNSFQSSTRADRPAREHAPRA